LTTLYKNVSNVLISRFGDREESVRHEIWATYALLITQTGVYGGAPQSKQGESGKRKRDEGMEVEDNPYTLLKSQVPYLAKALLKQLSSKASPATLQAGFSLLHSLLRVLPGSLSSFSGQIITAASSVLGSNTGSSSASANLHGSVLSFLTLFFSTHEASTFSSSLPTLTPKLLSAISQKHPRIASEAFRAFSALLSSLKPVSSADWVDQLYEEAVKRLIGSDTDAEVRQCAEDTLAELWLSATDMVKGKGGREWDALMKTARTEGAVRVVTRVAGNVSMDGQWVGVAVHWAISLLGKAGRSGKAESFNCLEVLLRR